MKAIPLIARICLAAVFLWTGIGKVLDPAGTQQQIAGAGVPLPVLSLVGAIVFELLGALSVLLGYKARWGAIALIVFLIPTTLLYHTNFTNPMQLIQFLKNLALIGGLLMVVYIGSGPFSFDAQTASRNRW